MRTKSINQIEEQGERIDALFEEIYGAISVGDGYDRLKRACDVFLRYKLNARKILKEKFPNESVWMKRDEPLTRLQYAGF